MWHGDRARACVCPARASRIRHSCRRRDRLLRHRQRASLRTPCCGDPGRHSSFPYAETIQQFKEMASVLRREGPMGLQAVDISDDLMQFGTELILGGVADSETLSSQMMPRLDAIKADANSNQVVWVTLGTFAPAYGMIGTLVGLVAMLAALDDPSSIGPKMSVALITTLYGALIANAATAPIANKIGVNTEEELVYKDMVVAGMVELLNAPDPDGMVDMMLSRVPLGLLEEVTPQVREAEAG